MKTFVSYLSDYAQKNNISLSLISVIETIVEACIEISNQVRLGDLSGILGEAGTGNIQGEQQKKLDVLANHILIEQLSNNKKVAGIASEEEDNFVCLNSEQEYLVLFDPLDGSSNIDVNISIGTIFSILRKSGEKLEEKHFLQAGKEQVAAGYVLYGPQSILVLSFGQEVLMFTLNDKQDFIPNTQVVSIPNQTQEFAINMSNQRYWEPPMQQYIHGLLQGKEGERQKDYNMRWVASMVAEVHRILIRGGIFLYPKDSRETTQNGKLRLLYEANPMSFIVQAAGGKASSLASDILDIKPQKLHQRIPVVLGASEEVDFVEQLHMN
ncbi:class 1 fructose-bisphosphatase [Neisseriaceae bacterium PsAf]|nr:class 1 fructose-bisphosphatase [Neisseriaceae bacterium PsAf]MCV2503339.1 class 1 fructose-bisphosphatase [Neisseriaceae bacterium]